MSLWGQVRSWRSLRHSVRMLGRIADATERQALAMERIANKIDPAPPAVPDPADLRTLSGVAYHPDAEAAKIEAYIAQCLQDTKRLPTDEEICRYLDGEDVRLGHT